jgi:hypothetical protein
VSRHVEGRGQPHSAEYFSRAAEISTAGRRASAGATQPQGQNRRVRDGDAGMRFALIEAVTRHPRGASCSQCDGTRARGRPQRRSHRPERGRLQDQTGALHGLANVAVIAGGFDTRPWLIGGC